MSEYTSHTGAFIIRNTSDGRTIFCGAIPGQFSSSDKDEIWIMNFDIFEADKFKIQKYLPARGS